MNDTTLQDALKYGIIDEDEIAKLVRMNKVESIHSRPITQLPNGRWQTYVTDPETGKLKEIKLATREKVIERLYKIYFEGEKTTIRSLESLYKPWLDYKKNITNSPNTITRHKQHYKKYFDGTPLFKRDITKIKILELNEFCNLLVKDNNLTLKEWMNVKTVLNGIFEYAYDKGYISVNPMERVKITVKYKQVNKRSDGSQRFDTEEREEILQYMNLKFHETHDPIYIAVQLQFLTGLRIGELVALKWGDIDFESHAVHVMREESRIKENNDCVVVNHTKGNQDRFVCMTPKAEALVKSLDKGGDFLFMKNGERVTARQVTYAYEKYARVTGHDMKRSHKARKTYASLLQHRGVPIDEIRKQLGQQDLSTTMQYLFNPLTNAETYAAITSALR